MKITSVELYSNNKHAASFSFRDPGALNPYIVQGIFGLDADEIIPKFYSLSPDGLNKYYDLTLRNREIVIRVALNPNTDLKKTYSELRDDLYRAISSSRTGLIQLRFNNNLSTVAAISGRITKFEAPHFNQTPEVQLTVKCSDYFLRALDPVEVNYYILETPTTIVDPFSTAPHGFSLNIKFTADTPSFIMRDSDTPSWIFTVTPGVIGANTGFKINDELYFSSENDKQIYIVRASTKIQLVDKVQPGSFWPMMFPGENDFEVVTGTFTWGYLTYYPTYWGV
jgi:hypothetical protein